MIAALALILLAIGIYATLLGFGKVATPKAWCNREEALWLGRFALLFGMLFLLDSLGITPHTISGWLEDILTSGGGGGTG
jgi:hypothetical protein